MDYVNEKLFPRRKMKGRRGFSYSKGTQKRHDVFDNINPRYMEVRKSKNKFHKDGYETRKKKRGIISKHEDGGLSYDVSYSINKKKRWELLDNLKKEDGLIAMRPKEGGDVKIGKEKLEDMQTSISRKNRSYSDDENDKEEVLVKNHKKGKKKSKLSKRRYKAPSRKLRVSMIPGMKNKKKSLKTRRMRGAKKAAKYKLQKQKEDSVKLDKSQKEDIIDTFYHNEDQYTFTMMENRKKLFEIQRGNRGYSPEFYMNWLAYDGKTHTHKKKQNIKKEIKKEFDVKLQ